MQYKIVDTFNGYEGPQFDTQEEAEAELEKRREQFYAQPGNGNAWFCQRIITVNEN